jgi:hypothetical protein
MGSTNSAEQDACRINAEFILAGHGEKDAKSFKISPFTNFAFIIGD